jgi:mevalonate kinase
MNLTETATPLATGHAPGKLILVGEHAVVYGAPAIAVPVSAMAATASVWPADRSSGRRGSDGEAGAPVAQGPSIEAHFPPEEQRSPLHLGPGDDGPLPAVARAALQRFPPGVDPSGWRITLHSTIPPGRGLGSSAAVAVALARALLGAAGVDDPQAVPEATLAGEAEVHGRPSGIDHHTILAGATTWLEAGRPSRLAVGLPLELIIADTGARGSTGDLVAALAKRRAMRPATHARWADRIARLAVDARRALASGQGAQLGRVLDANHLVLQAMRLSTPELDTLVAAARRHGAWGAKLSGAGGGGVMFALVPAEQLTEVESALRAAGALRTWRTTVAAGPTQAPLEHRMGR